MAPPRIIPTPTAAAVVGALRPNHATSRTSRTASTEIGQRQARAEAEGDAGVVRERERERPDQVDRPRGEPRDGEGLGDLVGGDHGNGDRRRHLEAPGALRGLVGRRSPDGAGPVVAGRAQRLESPPLLQSMHKRA